MAKIVSVDSENLGDSIDKAAKVILEDGIVVFPTRAFYGIGANAFSFKAVEKVYHIKQRNYSQPILILIADIKELAPLVRDVPASARDLIKRYWPGKVTLVFHAAKTLPDNLTGGTGKIGIRLVGHPVARELVKAVGRPITGTSANISGRPACSTVDALDNEIVQKIDLVLDSGRLAGDIGSTVIDVTVDPPKVLREGVVTFKQ
ncbi:MAG: threonylcarbamoyl-AMP synthase [Deltaproteobacteria bacterium]|nr:threonylcarbamoyl-AMP synthase [Deltaproteobacteria bacterium]